MKNFENSVHVEGYVFSHTLENRITGPNSKNPNTPFIMGEIQIATDAKATNVVPVRFSYVTETYAKSGKPNATYAVLQQIIDAGGSNTYEVVGTDALKVRVDGDIEVNDFYTREGELASPKRIRGSFVHTMNGAIADKPATFSCEMVISKCVEVERENEEPYVTLGGYVFNFRNAALPIELNVRSQGGMDYFIGQDISNKNPMVTKVWGNIVSTIIRTEHEVESAWGEPQVDVTTRTIRTWDIEGASSEPMDWDDESTITKDELKKALADREVMLAAEKKRTEEYRASRSGQRGFPTAAAATKKNVVVEEEDDEDFVF